MVRRILAWLVGLLVTALYAYVAFTAVSNLVLLPQLASSMDLAITANGWFWLVFGVTLPVLAYAIALVIGRRRSAAQRILLLLVGICVVAAVQLEVTHLVPQSGFFA